MKRFSHLIISVGVCFVISSLMMNLVFANSAQTQWTGTDASGMVILDEDCPLVVEKELLTFDIQEFPKAYYQNSADFNLYSGKATAEYTIYNPTDTTITATLVFPFGGFADYLFNSELMNTDIEKYDITMDYQTIDKKLRHTYMGYGQQFDLEKDLPKLQDGFMQDEFYYPKQPVTRYIYKAKDVDKQAHNAATAAFFLTEQGETKLYMENQSGGSIKENGILLTTWVDLEQEFSVYVIGEALKETIDWKFYHNGACEEEIEGIMELVSVENCTFKDFALSSYQEEYKVLDYDWYNAVVALLNKNEWTAGALDSSSMNLDVSNQLMRWYQYEIMLEPKQRIVNTVTAPIYPSINDNDTPTTYQYTYLLSPAKTWKEFSNLDIVVNTPYFMIENSLGSVEQNDDGYLLHLDNLPSEEFVFTLCEVENPKLSSSYSKNYTGVKVGTVVLFVGILAVIKKLKYSK